MHIELTNVIPGHRCSSRRILREFDGRDWPLSIVTLDRNSEAVEFVEPYVFDRPGYSISQDDSFANKLSLSLIERGKDGGRSGFGDWHGLSRNRLAPARK
jgi:hypothetical protein